MEQKIIDKITVLKENDNLGDLTAILLSEILKQLELLNEK